MIVETQGLRYQHGGGRGVHGLDLQVPRGARFGFLGPNGAGKTTTLRILMGFLRAQGGTAQILGLDCWRHSTQIKQSVGYLPGDLRVPPGLSARDGLALLSRLHGRDLRHTGRVLCDRLELDPTLRAQAMSRGTRQKLGLVLALAPLPPLLVLDEPTTALDPLVQLELLSYLRERAGEGATVLLSSHTLSEVEAFCDRVLLVRDGHVVAHATMDALREQARRRVRLRFASVEQAAATTPPPCLELEKRQGQVWEASLVGPPAHLLRWAANLELADCEIAPPDLERLFAAYYQGTDAASPRVGAS